MASGFNNGIGIDLKALDWGETLDGMLDMDAIREAGLETGDEMEDEIQNNFEDREDGWKALAVSTIKQRVRAGFEPGPIMLRSGTLKENCAANREVTLNNGVLTVAVFPAEATAPYSSVPITEYAAALDAVRPFYDFDDDQAEKLLDILEEKLADKLGFI